MEKILVTGCAGFIGFHVSRRLLESGRSVIGLDNLNTFYDEGLKKGRLGILEQTKGFEFVRCDLADRSAVAEVFRSRSIGPVIHMAAQAGVRHSLEDPHLYVQSNIVGFVNLIDEAHRARTPHFVYASSSSVYGANSKIPFSEQDNVDHPISVYAATKKCDEVLAHVYAHLYSLPVTGLRFFTVYGPWGRPDMAIFKFCRAICAGTPIEVYNHGAMRRDFTYIDDVVEGIVRIMARSPGPKPGAAKGDASPYYRVYNIGNNQPVELARLIQIIEARLGKKAVIRYLPMQAGDVPVTYADIDDLATEMGYCPSTSIEEGISRFVDWYRGYAQPS